MSYINPLQDTSGNLSFSSNSTSILDKSLYYNFWNDINQKPSFCNIAFSADYIDISNKPNLNPLSTSSNLYYSSNSYHSSFSNLNYITSNNLINFTDNKLNNLNSSLWGTIGNHIYSNLGSVGIGTSSLGNNKLVIKGNLKSDDFKIKGMGFSNLLITSNILDNKSNLLYTSISNQDYLSKNKQITSSQFTTDINKNLYIINSNIGIGTSSNLINDMILINGNTNVNDFKIKGTSSSNLLITSNILDNSSNYLIENFNSNFNKYSSSIWSNSTNSSIYITSNLGIGSTIPNQILDIYGNIRISGSILPNSCNSFDLGSLNKKWKDLYISGNSIYLNDFIIRNSNNYLNISNIDVSSINFLNNLNTNSNIISLNTNGDFMIGNKYLLGINEGLYSSNIIFSNVLSNSSNSLINLNNSKFNSSNSTDLIKIANKRFITNDIYNRPATFSGILESYNLTTSNLNVIGDYTNFNTTIYQTEQLFIENSCNYPAMIIKQMNINKNVAEFYNSNYSITNVSVSGTGNSINNIINESNYKYALFNSNGTFSTDNNIICDILIVGGGGGGGTGGGGGGAGAVLYTTNFNISNGTYSIIIGNGGLGSSSSSSNGNNGSNSSITINGTIYTAVGGGGGGTRNDSASYIGRAGNNGGSGGGGSHSDSSTNINIGGSSSKNTYLNWISLGNVGGEGKDGNSDGYGSGGGGGAGSVGANAGTNSGGNGGSGINLTSIFTSNVGNSGWFAGGGGGGSYTGTGGQIGYGNGGSGLLGGGGNAYGGNGLANTGGGGGGANFGASTGGSGGSGVVIIRYAIKNPDIQMKFLVNSNGNVGIETINPISKLDVIGSINSKGFVVNNNEIINQIKTNDSNYSNSLFYSWNYSNNLFLSLSNSIENIKNSKQDLLNSSTILLGNGANITNVNYNNLINKPDLSIYSTSVNSTSNSLFINVSNIDYYSSNSNISYVNNETDNLIKFLWNTNGNNVFTNSNVGIGSLIPAFSLDIDGNLNTNEFLIKQGNLSNSFITSNIFDNRSNNYYSSLSNLDYNSSNSNVNYVNNIVNTAINNYNSYLDSIDLWKTGVNNGVYINSNINILDNIFSLGTGSLSTSITSTCNSLVLSQNSIIKYNYTNNTNINSGTYNVVFNNGSITFGGLNPDKSYPILSNLNPIVWYKFDDSSNNMVKEASLNVNSNLVLFNNPTFDSINYTKGNGSIYLNNPSTASTQIYATIPTNVLPASYLNSLNIANGLSFSFWIKLSSSSIDYGRILYFGNFQSGSPYYDNTNYRLQIRTSSPKTSAIYFDIVKDGFYTFQYNANMYDDTWKHIIWTISSSGNWNIYVNNSIICNNQSKFVFPLLSSTNLIYILGVDKHPTNYGMVGNYDDFRIYSQVLTSNQVQELYNGRVDVYNLNNNNLNTNITITSNLGSITNSITSTCNALVLSGNSLARFNYTNDVAINSGTYDISINGGISIGESPFVRPWGAYFANDWSGTTLLDSSGNGRHATTSGTITKYSGSGNGASGSITYISGGTSATITWPSGSIPTNFTILSLTRYTGGSRGRIFDTTTNNWLHGHWNGNRGVCHYDGWKTPSSSIGIIDDWLCCIGKNGGTTPNNILVDGTGRGNATGGTGNLTLTINNGVYKSGESSDWALSAVIIYDSHLTDAHMVKLNNFINTYKSSGNLNELKLNILRITDNSYPILRNGNGTIINPIAWYKFDSSSTQMLLDNGTSGNNLINNGATFDNINKIRGNGSINFSGTSSFVELSQNLNIYNIQISNGITISFWIKMTNVNDYGKIMYFGNSSTSQQFTIQRDYNGNQIFLVNNGAVRINIGYNPFISNTWIHMVWCISSSGINSFYVNNINQNITYTQSLISNFDYSIKRLGAGPGTNPNDTIIGNIDDFRIYSQELTSNQVEELYNGRIDIYNYIPVNNYSSNLLIKGDMNITGNLKLNNNLLKLIETPTISITGTGNSINIATDDSNYRYALFNSNGTFSTDNNIICDILIVGGGGGGGTRAGGGGGAGSLIYKTNQILNSGFYSVTIGNGGAGQPYSTTTSYIGNDGGDTLINFNGINIYIAKGGGGGAYNLSSLGRIGGSCGGNSSEQPQTPLAIPYNIQNEPDGIYGNQGGGGGLTGNGGYAGGGGGGAGSFGGTRTTTNAGNGGSGLNINITGVSNLYAGGGGGGAGRYNSVIAGTGGSGIGGVGGTLSTTPGGNGLANTGSGGGGSGFGTLTNEWDNNGASGSGGSGVVIIRYAINQPVFSGAVNYSNIRNRPYLLDLLTSSNIINVGEENNINFPLSITSWKNEWFLFIGTSPTNIPNSFIFHHITPTINSKWWFNGTTSTTKAEISDERIKKEINDLSNGLHKLMLLNPKEYFLCDDKDYHKKYGIIAQDVSQIPELSHLVHKDTDFIANIYSSGSYDNSNGIFIITSSKKIDGLIEINDELKILLDNKENPEIIIEELPYDNRYKKRFVKVKNIINDFSFEIFDDIELNEIDKSILFIYGKKINDFLKLDYNSLYTLNIKANQEIYDIINNSYNTLNNLTTRIKILEDKLS